MRSTRRESTDANTGESGMSNRTSVPASCATTTSGWKAASTHWRTSTRSADRSATPASWREISSRSASSISKRSSSAIISSAARRVCGSRDSAS